MFQGVLEENDNNEPWVVVEKPILSNKDVAYLKEHVL